MAIAEPICIGKYYGHFVLCYAFRAIADPPVNVSRIIHVIFIEASS
jgi:hypothetical protein